MHNEFKFDLPNDKHVIVFWCRKFVHACASVSSSRGIERYLLTRFYLFPLSQRQGCLFFPLDVEAGHGRIIRKRGVPSDAARVHRASWIRIRHFSVKNSSQHLWLSHVPDRQLLPVGWNRGALWNLFRMPRVGRGHDKREIKASFEEFLRSNAPVSRHGVSLLPSRHFCHARSFSALFSHLENGEYRCGFVTRKCCGILIFID